MSQWILTSTKDIILIQTLCPLLNLEHSNTIMKQYMKDFDTKFKKKLEDSSRVTVSEPKMYKYPSEDIDASNYLPYKGLYDKGSSQLPNDYNYNTHDMIIHTEVMLPHNGEQI